MNNEINRHADTASNGQPVSGLKASDFFPPGTGWNKVETSEQKAERERLEREAGAPTPPH